MARRRRPFRTPAAKRPRRKRPARKRAARTAARAARLPQARRSTRGPFHSRGMAKWPMAAAKGLSRSSCQASTDTEA